MSIAPQGNFRTFIQAVGLEIKRQWVWMVCLAGILLVTSVVGNLLINQARVEMTGQMKTDALALASRAAPPEPPAAKQVLVGEQGILRGYEHFPEEKRLLETALMQAGMGWANTEADASLVLTRNENRQGVPGILVRAKNPADVKTMTARVSFALNEDDQKRLAIFLQSHPEFPKAPQAYADPQQTQKELEQLLQSAPLLLRMLLAVGVVFMMTFIGAASLGLEWDMRRAASTLEPWVLTPKPIWILYGSQLVVRSLVAVIAVATWATPTFVLAPEISWLWAGLASVSLLVFCVGLSALVGMWGLLSTMLFHHRYGRLFGRLALAPISLMAIALYRSSMAIWVLQKVGEWMQGRLTDNSWWGVAAGLSTAGGLMLLGGLALVPLVNARIGRRRQGLRKL